MLAVPRAANVWPSDPARQDRRDGDRRHAGSITPTVIARLVRSEDFERVLRTHTRVNSLHFAVHHLCERPSVATSRLPKVAAVELSTGDTPVCPLPVDDSVAKPPSAVWLGAVVPKRHARRAVTRTLLKRQIRAAVCDRAAELPAGLWVVRLRAPFDRKDFVSAASDVLKQVARSELEQLICRAVQAVSR